jgi:uncharacterized membrane protein
MNTLHPFLSSFPVALILICLLLELLNLVSKKISVESAVSFNLILAFVFSVAAFISGYSAKELASITFVVPEDPILWHHYWGRALLFALVPCIVFHLFWKRNRTAITRLLYLVTLMICSAIVVYVGWLGGELVFKRGAGVAATELVTSSTN